MGDTLEVEKPYLRLAGMIAGNLGTLSLKVVRHYLANAAQIPAALEAGFIFPALGIREALQHRFTLLLDLGVIEVPSNYNHHIQLTHFRKRYLSRFESFPSRISDENFISPSHVLRAGDKLYVRAYSNEQGASSDERMAFLALMNAVHPGAQGLTLLWEQKHDQLKAGYSYASLDDEERLYRDGRNGAVVPEITVVWNGRLHFDLHAYNGVWWGTKSAMLCFTQASTEEIDRAASDQQFARSLSSISAGGS